MKLTKLSLAAIIAVGALGSFASATPIEEAIKGVDVSGLVRYRYYYGTEFIGSRYANIQEDPVTGELYTDDKESFNRYSASLNVLTPIADAFSAGVSVRAEGNFAEGERKGSAASYGTLASVTGLDKAFFQYAANGVTAKIGKFEIPTPWTESGYNGNRGNGVLALYSGVKDWTFAGAYYNQVAGTVTDGLGVGERDLYAVAAIGAAGPVALQFWAAHNVQVFDTVYAEAVLNLNGIYAKGQVNWLKLADETITALGLDPDKDDGLFFGVEGGYKGKSDNVAFNAIAGYTKNDKDQGIYALDDDNDGFIRFGKQLYYATTNSADTQVLFLKGGVVVDKFGVELGVGQAEFKDSGDKWKPLEGYLTGSYAYAKNFGFELYYSYLDLDDGKVNNEDANHEIRFQAQYKF
ncbi:MAG: major outer membrane protein [Campylobacteraceae bacterium]|jgi:hypothetical protein|nr:major outer membrane protein [Campylobacteraceae bacterium]